MLCRDGVLEDKMIQTESNITRFAHRLGGGPSTYIFPNNLSIIYIRQYHVVMKTTVTGVVAMMNLCLCFLCSTGVMICLLLTHLHSSL